MKNRPSKQKDRQNKTKDKKNVPTRHVKLTKELDKKHTPLTAKPPPTKERKQTRK
jgi:hypothetical protein